MEDDSLWEQFLPDQQHTTNDGIEDLLGDLHVHGTYSDDFLVEQALYEEQYAEDDLDHDYGAFEAEDEEQLMANEALWEELLEDAEASISDGSIQMEERIEEEEISGGDEETEEEASRTEPAASEAQLESDESSVAAEMLEKSVYKAQELFSPNGWAIKNDFYTFLNQCSIQSFSFLLKSMHDPQTALWIDAFTKPTIEDAGKPGYTPPQDFVQPGKTLEEDCKLLSFHGLNAIDMELFPTWDVYFEEMAKHPTEIYTVESSTAQAPDYELDINPIRLCSRLLAVREQIALEFVNDLQVLSEMSGQTVVAYWDSVKEDEEKEGNEDSEEEVNIDDIMAKDGREIKIESGNLMFLDISVKPGMVPSPLRKGNFDLLKLMATQEAIHRVLNDPERQEGARLVSNNFLRDFYAARFSNYFDGNVQYGGALSFMQELFEEPPVFREVDGKTALIDPVRLAGMVLAKREEVALEWKELAAVVPDEHLAVQRFLLTGDIIGASAPGLSFEEALRAGSCEEDNTNTVPWGDQNSIPEVTDDSELEGIFCT